jgi:hypothetical protein
MALSKTTNASRKPRRAELLLERAEARAVGRLHADLRALKGSALAALDDSFVRRHKALAFVGVALAGAVAVPLLVRLLRSPAGALRLASIVAPLLGAAWKGGATKE